jgi:hypothetical protein
VYHYQVPEDGYIISLEQLLLMGRDLAEGKDVFSVDPRASPGSFLQVPGLLVASSDTPSATRH